MKIINIDNYRIILERKQLKLWLTGNSYRYMCIFHIQSELGTNLFDIVCTEADIVNLLETFYDYIMMSSKYARMSLNSITNRGSNTSYILEAYMSGKGGNSTIFTINEYSNIINTKVTFTLSDNINYNIEDFLIDISDYFISDIPDLTYLNPDFLR